MGIKIDTAPSMPALVYDRVHVLGLMIEQPQYNDDTKLPVYRVTIEYRLYAVHESTRYYHGPIQHVEVDDFIALAQKTAANGDTTLADALPAIERAVAAILSEYGRANVTEII